MLYQYQCQEEGTLFYYQHSMKPVPAHIVEFCPVCGTADVAPTGRTYPPVDEHLPINPAPDQDQPGQD